MKLKNEENDERSRGRMLDFDLPPLGPTAFWALFLASWSGAPNPIWLVGPRHTALYIEVGGRLRTRGSPQPPLPTDIPIPIWEGRSQWWETATVSTAPPLHRVDLHRASLPNRRWHPRTRLRLLQPLRLLMVCDATPLHPFPLSLTRGRRCIRFMCTL
jgi:hypothetical protein